MWEHRQGPTEVGCASVAQLDHVETPVWMLTVTPKDRRGHGTSAPGPIAPREFCYVLLTAPGCERVRLRTVAYTHGRGDSGTGAQPCPGLSPAQGSQFLLPHLDSWSRSWGRGTGNEPESFLESQPVIQQLCESE